MFNGSHNQEIKKNKINNSYKISIIVSQWNNDITELLYDGAISKLLEYGIKNNNIQRYDVPGSMELVFASQHLLDFNKKVDGIICLGCIIKGETDHDKYISSFSINKSIFILIGVINRLNKHIERKARESGYDIIFTKSMLIKNYKTIINQILNA